MRPPRFSIAGLMAFVLVLGLGLAALHRPTKLGASLAFGVATTALTFAAVAARVRRGSARLFWSGFAAFGWAYLLIHMGPWFQPQVGPASNQIGSGFIHYAPDLPGVVLLELAYPTLVPPQAPPSSAGAAASPPAPRPFHWPTVWEQLTSIDRTSWRGARPLHLLRPGLEHSSESYQQTGHAVLSLLAAFVGGFAARAILGRRERAGRPGGEEAA